MGSHQQRPTPHADSPHLSYLAACIGLNVRMNRTDAAASGFAEANLHADARVLLTTFSEPRAGPHSRREGLRRHRVILFCMLVEYSYPT
jgi:hypothetical protein